MKKTQELLKHVFKLIDHYTRLGIDPRTKTVVFSDRMTFSKAVRLFELFHNRINCSFGIRTNLNNNMGDIKNDRGRT